MLNCSPWLVLFGLRFFAAGGPSIEDCDPVQPVSRVQNHHNQLYFITRIIASVNEHTSRDWLLGRSGNPNHIHHHMYLRIVSRDGAECGVEYIGEQANTYSPTLHTLTTVHPILRRVKDRHTKWRDDLCIQCNALSFPLYNLAEAFAVFFEWNSGQDVKCDPQLRARRNSRSEKCARTEAIFNTKTENTVIKSWTNGNKFCTLCVTTLCSLM